MDDNVRDVWLDCDPGHDDALAIILAGYDKLLNLLGVSTVAGNQVVEKVTLNALGTLTASGLSSIEIHGESGLEFAEGGSMQDYAVGSPLPQKAVMLMFERISAQFAKRGRPVCLVCTGALTNAALLLLLYPEVIPMIEVVLMGGCIGSGNTGPVVEFNMQTDPEAAKVVFEAGVRSLTMVPLEVTHTALATPAVLLRIAQRQTPFLQLMQKLLLFFAQTYKEVFNFEHPPLHDPLAVFYVACPSAFTVRRMRVDIETCSTLSAGQTVCDIHRRQNALPENASVALTVDVEKFWDSMIAAILKADMLSPLNISSNNIA
ncbi:putative tRNA synthetase [Coccomyxa subellipsoidea C-169]|uniref:tRNA synthetase n=1 Tax=Coccomyxa subellipsoidea (strain C-169) TaxID=574566 RepID=I0YYS2_COCSC|nr:putative tRNA synthetase [Coccomyxa subellipsoidea C-169]EIE23541.1 putative tRNA synthetase [Coccomyxa subellipsoidea C-169]|eukprot:XP_005648085.1 putative tRNA synthetase [Coccomyxa subellipsoidea C-169]